MDCAIKKIYGSPRWSGEILDCSMPLTFDQYNKCSFDCLYCFSFFQRSLKMYNPQIGDESIYTENPVESVDPERIIKQWKGELVCEWSEYIEKRIPMQWGGLSDPLDLFEKKYGVGLELLRYFKSIRYPLCFSTKSTWWMDDERYREVFSDTEEFWNIKVSIINYDDAQARKMERGVPSPADRLMLIHRIRKELRAGPTVTLRLRPFIIGYSDFNDAHVGLIASAGAAGATALSTEFFCMEGRMTAESRERFNAMSEIVDYDIIDFYHRNSQKNVGYMRLNWKIKEPFVNAMEQRAKKAGMRFYVSDAHHKDRCANGSCCGLPGKSNYHRGQFTAALCLAKSRADGLVHWRDVEKALLPTFSRISVVKAYGLNIARGNAIDRARFRDYTVKDYIRMIWNSPNHPRSPYQYFHGLLMPTGTDDMNDVVYKYKPYSSERSEV